MSSTGYKHISTGATTLITSRPGMLNAVIVNTTAAGSITIYDALTAVSGKEIAILKASIAEGTYTYKVTYATGLCIVTAAASDLTISYN